MEQFGIKAVLYGSCHPGQRMATISRTVAALDAAKLDQHALELRARARCIKAGLALQPSSLRSLSSEDLKTHVETLQEKGISEWPHGIEAALVAIKFGKEVSLDNFKDDGSCERVVDLICKRLLPWRGDGVAAEAFNPLDPMLCNATMPSNSKADCIKQLLVDNLFLPLVRGSERTSAGFLEFAELFLPRIADKSSSVEGASAAAMKDVESILKAVIALRVVTPGYKNTKATDVSVVFDCEAGMKGLMALAMNETDFYRALYKKHAGSVRAELQEADDFKALLTAIQEHRPQEEVLPVLLEKLPVWHETLRNGATSVFDQFLMAHLDALLHNARQLEGDRKQQALDQYVDTTKSFATKMSKHLPGLVKMLEKGKAEASCFASHNQVSNIIGVATAVLEASTADPAGADFLRQSNAFTDLVAGLNFDVTIRFNDKEKRLVTNAMQKVVDRFAARLVNSLTALGAAGPEVEDVGVAGQDATQDALTQMCRQIEPLRQLLPQCDIKTYNTAWALTNAKLNFFADNLELCDLVNRFNKLPLDDGDGLKKDANNVVHNALVNSIHIIEAAEHFSDVFVGDGCSTEERDVAETSFTLVAPILERGRAACEHLKDVMVKRLESDLLAACESAKQVAYGMLDGSSWKKDLAHDADIDAVVETATATLLNNDKKDNQKKGKLVKDMKTELEKIVARANVLHETCELDTQPLLEKVNPLLANLQATQSEALLVKAMSSKSDPAEVQKKLNKEFEAIKKASDGYKTDVKALCHTTLVTRAEEYALNSSSSAALDV
eukprot:TRINITY_DN34856_c0_g1_i1.p1 TRINITY_DN34856_c0_g1~~TRINITY_DN34856_c0_g1_i1.p1  ORF type:complete len:784 (-),score=250.21 TRINITY_DN34856_c0_g1_i1:262-2613(-)